MTAPTARVGYGTPIQQLMNSGLTAHSSDDGGGYGKNAISIANIPYSSYSLYVYASNWNGDPQYTDDLKLNQNATGYTAGTSVLFKTFNDGSQTSYTTAQPACFPVRTTQVTDLLFAGMSASSVPVAVVSGKFHPLGRHSDRQHKSRACCRRLRR